MATETVIYVSLALVLLTRIFVFISPPEFLEEHQERRYHEYHLYQQYHLQKQYDEMLDSGGAHESDKESNNNSPEASDNKKSHPFLDSLDRRSSDELLLLGPGPDSRPFSLRNLSSDQESLGMSTTHSSFASSTSTLSSPSAGGTASLRDLERDNDLWRQILYSSEAASVPSFLTLDLSEIHYNGSLDDKFERDSEVLESIRALRAGQRDVNKECPDMTVVWEGGRWCCLEGRTLYILRALQWQGKVKVRVLVDKDPTLLAVTEDCWRAAGMATEPPLLSHSRMMGSSRVGRNSDQWTDSRANGRRASSYSSVSTISPSTIAALSTGRTRAATAMARLQEDNRESSAAEGAEKEHDPSVAVVGDAKKTDPSTKPKHGPNPTQSQSQSRSSGIKATTATAAAASGSFTIGLSLEDANEPVTAATISTTTTKASAEAMLEQAPGQQQNHVERAFLTTWGGFRFSSEFPDEFLMPGSPAGDEADDEKEDDDEEEEEAESDGYEEDDEDDGEEADDELVTIEHRFRRATVSHVY